MFFRVRSGFSYCVTSAGDVVLLDLDKARYFALTERQKGVFLHLADKGWRLDDAAPELSTVLHLGFIEQAAAADDLDPAINLPQADADIPQGMVSVAALPALIQALGVQFLITRRLKTSSLKAVLQAIAERRSHRIFNPNYTESYIQNVRIGYYASEIFLGRTDRCLVRSLAMFATLSRRGIESKLVIGVRTSPFAAHCWIQRGSVVINDVVEHVRNFTPILVLG